MNRGSTTAFQNEVIKPANRPVHLAEIIFESNSFDFDPVLNGYTNEHAWVESAYKTLIAEIR